MTIGTPTSLGSATSTSSISSLPLTTGANINAGDTVIVAFAYQVASGVTGGNVSSVTDGTNTYLRANFASDSVTVDVELWYTQNAKAVGSGATITANLTNPTGVGSSSNLQAATVSGMNGAGVFDRSSTGQATASTSLSTSIASNLRAQGSELAIGLSLSNTLGTETQSSGFANVNHTSAGSLDTLAMDYQIFTATGIITYAPTWSLSGTITQLLASFRGATFDMNAQSVISC